MFYYLIYNSSLGNYEEYAKRYITTFIYGSILYLVIHAYLHSSAGGFYSQLLFYFWIILLVDIVSIAYISNYMNLTPGDENDPDNEKNILQGFLSDLTKKIKGDSIEEIPDDPFKALKDLSAEKDIKNEKIKHDFESEDDLEDDHEDLLNPLELERKTEEDALRSSLGVTNLNGNDAERNNSQRNLMSELGELEDLDNSTLLNSDKSNQFHFEGELASDIDLQSDVGSEGSSGSDLDIDEFELSLRE